MAYNEGHYPSEAEIEETLADCRANNWERVLKRVIENPRLAVTKLPMENHIITTVMHQAITAKGDTADRANLILYILNTSPRAAGIPNGYASYPLHSIAQRNTKMDAKTKEMLIFVSPDCRIVQSIHYHFDLLWHRFPGTPQSVSGSLAQEEQPRPAYPTPCAVHRLHLTRAHTGYDPVRTRCLFCPGQEGVSSRSYRLQPPLLAGKVAHAP